MLLRTADILPFPSGRAILLPEGILGGTAVVCITEDGRILDTSPMREGKGVMELINGSWVPAKSPLLNFHCMVLNYSPPGCFHQKNCPRY